MTEPTKAWGSARAESLMETGTGWTKSRAPEQGELLAWERICKDIRTEFYSKKILLTLETSWTEELQILSL